MQGVSFGHMVRPTRRLSAEKSIPQASTPRLILEDLRGCSLQLAWTVQLDKVQSTVSVFALHLPLPLCQLPQQRARRRIVVVLWYAGQFLHCATSDRPKSNT